MTMKAISSKRENGLRHKLCSEQNTLQQLLRSKVWRDEKIVAGSAAAD
jgi:DNA-directed RNA polymerase subunit L